MAALACVTMEDILRYVTYAVFTGDASRTGKTAASTACAKTYLALGVPRRFSC